MSESQACRRVHLSWEGPLLEHASRWLAEELGADMSGVLVALPGAMGGRRLAELLARRIGPAWQPPQIVTAGLLTDRLVRVRGATAGRLLRTLAWERALAALPRAQLSRILARVPTQNDLSGRLRLAEQVRGLFGELAAEGLDFATIARGDALPDVAGESARWRALAAAEEGMAALIRDAGMTDPHLGRLEALDSGRLADVRAIVLVGVVEMTGLLRRALDQTSAPVSALVFAPESRADDYDDYGCLLPDAVIERGVTLPLESWHVVEEPDAQARRALEVVASWDARFAAEDITIGVADAEVAPYLRRRLAAEGVRARDAAGVPVSQTRPARLLQVVGAFLRRPAFGEFAALVRHSDLERALRTGADYDSAALLDAYQPEHLPDRIDGHWLSGGGRRDEHLAAQLRALHDALSTLLRELATDARRPLPYWVPELRRFLLAVYGTADLDPEREDERELTLALRAIGDVLAEVEELPAALAPAATAAEAVDLLLRSLRTQNIPPAASRAGEPTIELLGWLELTLDEAPALVVTGFEDGLVPENVHGDSFLPDGLRRDLGLADNRSRLARDIHATELLLHSRREVAFVSGRRSRAGDPRLPSRIVFHCGEDELLPRVRRFLAGERNSQPHEVEPAAGARPLPFIEGRPVPTEFSVTSFRTYLESPYRFYLERVLRIDTLDDRGRELDPLRFGTLAHDVLDAFGCNRELRDSTDAEAIHRFLAARVRSLGQQRFGERPLPAVALQLEQLQYRFEFFARLQAAHAEDGWRIIESEWSPEGGGVDFDVDGESVRIRGRIDRIDRHTDGRLAIWDYKAGDNVGSPNGAHQARGGVWRDLQLPLYCLLTAGFDVGSLPVLGYIAIGKDEATSGFKPVKKWTEETIAEAHEVAREVVRRVRKGEFRELGRWQPHDEILKALGGGGLVAAAPSGAEEDA